jgi:hypothetical protein
VAWAAVAVPASYLLFMHDSRPTVIAGHDVTVRPTHDSYATLELGAYLPNLRYPTDSTIGVRIIVGKTSVDSYQALLQRYALIGSHPEGEIDKVKELVQHMLLANVLKGSVIGLAAPLAWILLGQRRRRELRGSLTRRRAALIAVGGVVAVLATTSEPFIDRSETTTVAKNTWEPLADYLSATTVPEEAERVEVQQGLITSGTQRLIESAFTSYQVSLQIYDDLAVRAAGLSTQLHQPGDGETVALLVTDRHDNIGMDPVARAIGDAGGATILFDTGDDTSTGEPWESFSLDSLAETFADIDEKYQVPGNHDNGTYVNESLSDKGFMVLDGEPVVTDEGIRLLGVPDPRSSGLGSWRTTSGISFDDLADQLAEIACEANDNGERIATLLVHDANLGQPSLDRGCVDLVLAGHLHTQVGPDVVTGDNGQVGVRFTNGTTGGAAYAVAVGTKLRRDAQVSLITYRDGRPVGIQPVTISTTNVFTVEPYYAMPTPAPVATP